MSGTIDDVFEAINEGNSEKAISLLKSNQSLRSETRIAGRTPLHQAAFNGDREVAAYLIQHGANVNAVTEHGWSSLFYACAPIDESVGLLLIENGCDVAIRNTDGFTALHLAAEYGKMKIAAAILDKGAEISLAD